MDIEICCSQRPENLEEICVKLMRNDPSLTSFRPRTIAVLGCLIYFSSYPIDDVNAARLGTCLIGNTHVKAVELSLHPNLTTRGAKIIAAGIRQCEVTTVKIGSDSCDDTRVLKIIFEEGVQKAKSIRELFVTGPVGNFGSLSKMMSSLTVLELMGSPLSVTAVQWLSEGLKRTTTLDALTLRACELTHRDMRILAAGLLQNSSVKKLKFDDNSIDDQGVTAFVENWRDNAPIEELGFNSNENISIAGAMALIQAAQSRTCLQGLDLSEIKFGFDGIQMMAERLPQLRLKKFDISCCAEYCEEEDELDDDALEDAEAAGQAMLRAVQLCPTLQDSCPHGNYFPAFIENDILLYLELNKCGRYLISQDGVPPGLWSHVLAKCGEENTSSIYFFLREQPHLLLSAMNRQRGKKRSREDSMIHGSASQLQRKTFVRSISDFVSKWRFPFSGGEHNHVNPHV